MGGLIIMQYHYLLAGLEELHPGQKAKMPFADLLVLLREQMTDRDWQLLELLRRTGNDPVVCTLMEDEAVQDRFAESSLSEEDFRTQLLYEQGMRSTNAFVREWFRFNLNLNNVLAAAVCRKHGYPVEKAIVGDNEVAQELRKGLGGKNSNLAALLPELKEIVALSEIDNLLDRERHIDALRWQWIEEATLFRNFEVDNVLAYYLQAAILHRWDDLTQEHGEQVFRALLADLKKDVKI